MAGRRDALTPEAGFGLTAALCVLVIVSGIQFAGGMRTSVVGWLAVAPFLAASFAPWRYVAGVGLLASGLTALFAVLQDDGINATALARLVAMLACTAGAVAVAVVRQGQSKRYAELTRLATIAQEAVIRPIGPQVGQLAIAGRYVSASAAADIGGDLYEALDTPYGVRMIIGDVRGKGIDAIRLASMVLGSYRHCAYEQPDLRELVADLDRAVARSLGDEDFVTAVLVEERGGTLTVVNCGHPAPLLLRRGGVIALEPPGTVPPLGLGPRPVPRVEHLEPGDRLLLFTDGLAEARRAGDFFPTEERAWALLAHGTVEHGLASLESALAEWVRGKFDDDIALILLEYTGAAPEAEPAVPSWEIGGTRTARA
ncbi:MAG TPA: PP2C family protein-serine/threonine phosphatase [Micromonosporaceae bacterium]